MHKAIARSQSIKSDTRPGSEVIFSDLVVLDFEPVICIKILADRHLKRKGILEIEFDSVHAGVPVDHLFLAHCGGLERSDMIKYASAGDP